MPRLRRWLRTLAFFGTTVLVVPPFALHMRLTRATGLARERVRDRWVNLWASACLRIFGIRLRRLGLPVPPGVLVVANHRSAVDAGLLLRTVGGTLVARHDLASWPLLGLGASAADTLFVDRSDAKHGAVILRMLQRRLAAGQTVSVFPEGTTFDGDAVRAFHRGAFVAARGAKVPVVPVGIAYQVGAPVAFVQDTFAEHLATLAEWPQVAVVVRVGRPMPLNAGESTDAWCERVRAEVQHLVELARAALPETPQIAGEQVTE